MQINAPAEHYAPFPSFELQESDLIAASLHAEFNNLDHEEAYGHFNEPPTRQTEPEQTSSNQLFQTATIETDRAEETEELVVNEASAAIEGLGLVTKIRSRIAEKLQKRKLLWTAYEETRDSSATDKALLATTIGGYFFELGPGNEWLITNIGKEVLEEVASHGNITLSALCVGLGVGIASLVEHIGLGLNMNRNLKKFPKTIGVVRDSKLGKSAVVRNSEQRGVFGKFTNAYSVGAATVNLEDSVTDPEFIEKDKGVKRTLQSASLVGLGTLAIGTAAGGGIQHALNEGNVDLAYRTLGHVTNPLYWTGLFLGIRANDYRKNKKEMKQHAANSAVLQDEVV